MRVLQYAGLVISLLIAGYVFWKYKQGRYNRSHFLVGSALAMGLFILALFPSAGDLVAGPLQMERWNAVLFVSNLVAFALFFYVLNLNNALYNAFESIFRLVLVLSKMRW